MGAEKLRERLSCWGRAGEALMVRKVTDGVE
jgi:hypothetical protein